MSDLAPSPAEIVYECGYDLIDVVVDDARAGGVNGRVNGQADKPLAMRAHSISRVNQNSTQ